MNDGYHLSLGLARELWEELLAAALPVTLTEGTADIVGVGRAAAKQLGVRQRLAGLLEDRGGQGFHTPLRIRERSRALWRRRRADVLRRAREVVWVEMTWKVDLDQAGTKLRYGPQRVGADAWLKGTAEGTISFLGENIEIPFHVERRVGASVTLGDIRYDQSAGAVLGDLRDLTVRIGEGALQQVLARAAERVLEGRMGAVGPVPILRREQVEEMVGGLGGAFRVTMGVEDLALVVTEDDLTLRVRFGFAPGPRETRGIKQLEG
jgi:hypothetical protein